MHPSRCSARSSVGAALAAAALAATALPAGCGEDDSAGATVTVDAGQTAAVVGDEYSFDPETVIVEDGGGPLELELDNQGSLAHNLRVFDGAEEVGGTSTFQGGETMAARLELEPGAYRMVCTVGNHEELGMTGELEVR